jgi:hypothetical protein
VRGGPAADTELAQASAQLDSALVGGDPDDVASHFTEDAVLGESGADDAVGREAIRAFLVRGKRAQNRDAPRPDP